jgi:hypothetical protein
MEGFSRPGSIGGEATDSDDVEGHMMDDQQGTQPEGTDEDQDAEGHRIHLNDDARDEDVEGHRVRVGATDDEDVEGHRVRVGATDDEDVEGHRIKLQASDEDDVEGHRLH